MRCFCCDKALNDYESTLKSGSTGEYLDTCLKCLRDLEIETVGRDDLDPYLETEDEDYDGEQLDG